MKSSRLLFQTQIIYTVLASWVLAIVLNLLANLLTPDFGRIEVAANLLSLLTALFTCLLWRWGYRQMAIQFMLVSSWVLLSAAWWVLADLRSALSNGYILLIFLGTFFVGVRQSGFLSALFIALLSIKQAQAHMMGAVWLEPRVYIIQLLVVMISSWWAWRASAYMSRILQATESASVELAHKNEVLERQLSMLQEARQRLQASESRSEVLRKFMNEWTFIFHEDGLMDITGSHTWQHPRLRAEITKILNINNDAWLKASQEAFAGQVPPSLETSHNGVPTTIRLRPLPVVAHEKRKLLGQIIFKPTEARTPDQQTALLKLMKALLGELDRAKIIDKTLHVIKETFLNAQGVVFYLLDKQGLLQRMGSVHEADAACFSPSYRLREGFIGHAYQRQAPFVITDLTEESWPSADWQDAQACRSLMVVPVRYKGEARGLVCVYNVRETHAFHRGARELLETMAMNLALALETSRLYKRALYGQKVARWASHQAATAYEDSHREIAHALHDEWGARLFSLQLRLVAIQQNLPPQQKEFWQSLQGEIQFLGEFMRDMRQFWTRLYPNDLSLETLQAAIEDLLIHLELASMCEFTFDLDLSDIAPQVNELYVITLYRCVQLALTNVKRHAQAQHVEVRLTAIDRQVILLIEDDGCGFDVEAYKHQSLPNKGLVGMKWRVNALKGTLNIVSHPHEGTQIKIALPLLLAKS
jgi:signal transduction histidine kinase